MVRSLSEEFASKAAALIAIGTETCDFFLDQHGAAFAWVKNPGRVLSLASREFRGLITHQFYMKYGDAAGNEAVAACINVLAAMAYARKERIELFTRVFFDETRGKLLVDVCNGENECIKITTEGWSASVLTEPRFRRFSHMAPLHAESGSANDLKEVISSFRLKNEDDEVLLVAFVGTAFIPNIPHVILLLHGPQGSTKTTATTALRRLVDPSSLASLSPSDRHQEFVQQLAHNYFVPFDNVGRLRAWQVDNLCRAATGEGFVKRQLYTDEDDLIFAYRRVIALNGINYPAYRGDFLDRSLPVELSRVPRGERKEDRVVQGWLARKAPLALGAIFDGLSRALGTVDQIRAELKELPRMADFVVWGEAFCRAVGYPPLQFYNRYMERIGETSSAVLENDVIAELILLLMEDARFLPRYLTKDISGGPPHYEGTASDLLKALSAINDEAKFADRKEMPASPRMLSAVINELAADLADAGYKVVRKKVGKGGTRRIFIVRTPPAHFLEGSSSAASAAPAEVTAASHDSKPAETDATDEGREPQTAACTCVVCGKDGGSPHVARPGVVYLHSGCEEKWDGDL